MPADEAKLAELHSLLVKRNRIAIELNRNKDLTIKVPLLNINKQLAHITTNAEADALHRTLNAFISSDRDTLQDGIHTVAAPMIEEMYARSNEDYERVAKEAAEAYQWREEVGLLNEGKPYSIDQWNDRIAERYQGYKDPAEYSTRQGYANYVDRVYKKTLLNDEEQGWDLYKENYINSVEKIVDSVQGTSQARKARKLLKRLKEMPVSNFKKAYYTDLSGDIDFVSLDPETVKQSLERLQGVKGVFNLAGEDFEEE